MSRVLVALSCAAILLAGCGLTGDLYLPEDAAAGTDAQADSQIPSAEEDDDIEADEE